MGAALFLLVSTAVVGSVVAQYPAVGCTRHVTMSPPTYSVPNYQPQCHCQCQQYQPHPPRMNLVSYNYCQPPSILQQNIVPPSSPVYQPPPIIVPLPPLPKDCQSAHTTVTAPPLESSSNMTLSMPSHPPICVQTVYVAKDEEEEKKEKKCECKKKRKNRDEYEDRIRQQRIIQARRTFYLRQQMIKKRKLEKIMEALKKLQKDPSDPFDPGFIDPSDPFDPGFEYPSDPLEPPSGKSGGSGGGGQSGGDFTSDGFPCDLCRLRPRPYILVDASRP